MADVGSLFVSIGLDVENLEKGIGKAKSLVSGFAGNLSSLASAFNPVTAAIAVATAAVAALAAGFAGLAVVGKAAFDFANQVDGAMGKLQARLGATDKEMQALKKSALNIFGKNFGNNIDDVAEGLALVEQQIGRLNDAELEQVTKGAFALRDTFGVELPESIQAVDVLMTQFGLSGQQALDFITAGFQQGLNSSDDFIDTITEYSNLFSESGASASQFFSVMETGLQGGVLGTDKVADLWKEFQIRLLDGSDLTKEGLDKIGISYQTLHDQILSGSVSIPNIFHVIQQSILDLNDPLLQNQVGVALFGTQFEDLGVNAVMMINSAETSLDSLAGATDSLNAQYNTLGATWEGVKRQAMISLLPIGDILLNSLKMAMPQIERFFQWFQITAIPMVNDFVARASDVLLKFFGNFNSNFGPSIQRVEDGFMMMGRALGIVGGDVSGIDGVIKVLEKSLDGVAFVVNIVAGNFKTFMAVVSAIIYPIRVLYDLVKDLVSFLPKLVGSPIMKLSGGKTFQQLAGFAEGGSVSGGVPIVVGERGPEIFMPGTSGQIIPNNQIGGTFTSLTVSNEYVTGLRTIESITNKIVEASQKLLETFDGLVASVKSLAGGLNSVKAPDVAAPSSFSSFSGNTAKRQTKSPAALAFEASQRAKIEASFDNFKEVNPKAIDRQKTRDWYLRNLAAGVPRDELEKLLPPGFAQGGQFVVPPGFPNDSYMMGVTSGELVTVVPQNQVNRTMYNSLTIHSNAQTENLAADYNMMAAWESD